MSSAPDDVKVESASTLPATVPSKEASKARRWHPIQVSLDYLTGRLRRMASAIVLMALATALCLYWYTEKDLISLVVPSIISLVQDASVWVLLAPLIFRPQFVMAGYAWAAQPASAMTAEDNGIDFRLNRYLVNYGIHLATFIVAWILFVVRYFPEAINLAYSISHQSYFLLTKRDIYCGILCLTVALRGLAVFWMHPKFIEPDMIRAYHRHHLLNHDMPPSAELLGPLMAPPCNLTRWRYSFLALSIETALVYPHAL